MTAFWWLLRREVVRFVRRPSQMVSTVATPVLVWVFLASGFGGGGGAYAGMLAPGVAMLIVLFATVLAGMSLIEDRHAGFLQGVLVSPASRWSIAGSKLAASSCVATAQGLPILAAGAVLVGEGDAAGVALASLVLLASSVAVGGFGLALAWWIDSARGFHGIFTVALMPLWILSGAVFPEDVASAWVRVVAGVNPVGWCRSATDAALRGGLGEAWPDTAGTAAFAAAGALAAVMSIGRPRGTGGGAA